MTSALKKRPLSPKTLRFFGGAYLSGMTGCPSLTPHETKLALRHLRGRHKWRNRALLILGIRTGMRISELLSLRISQVWNGKAMLPRLYLERQDSKGKRTGCSIVLHPRAAAAVEKWIRTRGTVKADDWLFPSQVDPNRHLGRHGGWHILHHAFLSVGVVGMAGTHCMRKTFANNVHTALRGDLFRLSKALRHRSAMTTLCYLSFKQEEIDAAILRA